MVKAFIAQAGRKGKVLGGWPLVEYLWVEYLWVEYLWVE
jgi:hypothetical protein